MSKTKVMVVDDEPEMLAFLGAILEELLFEVIPFESGQRAVKYLEMDHEVRLILIDINLPDMNGFDLLKKILPLKQANHMKIFMVTGKHDKEIVLQAIKDGADDFIVKPLNASVLQSKILSHFKFSDKYAK